MLRFTRSCGFLRLSRKLWCSAATSSKPQSSSANPKEEQKKLEPCDTFHFRMSTGDEWVDIRGHDNFEGTDAEFVATAQNILLSNGIHERCIREVSSKYALPHSRRYTDDVVAIVLRYSRFEENDGHVRSECEASLFDLTDRITVFIRDQPDQNNKKMLTVHRRPAQVLKHMRDGWNDFYKHKTAVSLLHDVVKGAAISFHNAAKRNALTIDEIETKIFNKDASTMSGHGELLQQLYALNRVSSVQCRILQPMEDVYLDAIGEFGVERKVPKVTETRQAIKSALGDCDAMRETIHSLLSLHFSVVTYRIEELVRLLTVFSTIFIPLGFLTAVFGMNFDGIVSWGAQYESVWIGAFMMVLFGAVTVFWINALV